MTETLNAPPSLNLPPVVPSVHENTSAPAAEGTQARGIGAVAIVLLAVVNAWLAIAAYHWLILPTRLPPPIGVVDLASVYRDKEAAFTRIVSADDVSARERERAIDMAAAFARDLPLALEALSQECGCIVLASNAVAGRFQTVDLTAALRLKVGL